MLGLLGLLELSWLLACLSMFHVTAIATLSQKLVNFRQSFSFQLLPISKARLKLQEFEVDSCLELLSIFLMRHPNLRLSHGLVL